MIITSSKNIRGTSNGRRSSAPRRITASQSITSQTYRRSSTARSSRAISAGVRLSPEKSAFCAQIQRNIKRSGPIMGATNTTNIMARPDFLEMLPTFVQKLLVLDLFGSVAMKSRQQLIPYFKFIAENSKGATNAGDVLSSPFSNRQGVDPDFGGRAVRNEKLALTSGKTTLAFDPILPGSVTVRIVADSGAELSVIDKLDGSGELFLSSDETTEVGTISYSDGELAIDDTKLGLASGVKVAEVYATYQYDNENVGHDSDSYGAKMGKGYLMLDEINLVAEAHELSCYWSIFSAFAAQQEYGANVGNMAKEAAFGELTAEINTQAFLALERSAIAMPQFNWDASPVKLGSVVPSDFLNMFKLTLGQAAASVFQKTRLTQPNKLSVGTTCAEYIKMINGFKAESTGENVGPYKLGTLDQFEVYVCPEYNPVKWVMSCKSNDIRRNSGLFGEYMPLTSTDPIVLANASGQQGYATMYAMDVVNPDTVVSGKILGAQ